ncbi:hypothetical protein MMIC_P1966 [Mariprofundus micogutta]|uniref:DUF1232 domain-containing protein n=1 Tax=Mariprofundus micogutta TaxID=1921010 RepID=A0A1L8CPZ9_9PROT|nr:DUF1232 domain-containing protein [Mariprofundus micogutta]GAV20988.1 hypothetical protein MMIC_P1966 [Mariprofundus micogutta]
MNRLKGWAESLRRDSYALYLAARNPQVSPFAKFLIAMIVAYILSPIDLIPDFIPVIGYLDDLLLLPLAIALVIRAVPEDVWHACRQQASNELTMETPYRTQVVVVIVLIWLIALAYFGSICLDWYINMSA